ncbi:MAG: hypothetical protein HQ475_02060 [SAR202 cluster bacterium]|nr:hypothetical protein [SAR202 cluster bacterium]
MKKIRFPLALLVLAVVALSLPLMASADHSWGNYHWDISTNESIDSPLQIGDQLNGVWDSSLIATSADWNDLGNDPVRTVLFNGIAAGSNTDCSPIIGRVEACNSEYGENGWLGLAQIWVYRGKDGHIAQALVKVNDTYFNTPTYNTPAWRDFVMCQEVGHTFGLGHQDETFDTANLGTCMDYTNDPDGTENGQASNLHPNQHDFDVLYQKYGHLNGVSDGKGGGGTNKPGGGNGGGKGKPAQVPGDDISQWGKAISTDGNGRPNEFELTLRNGDKMITHVLWAN